MKWKKKKITTPIIEEIKQEVIRARKSNKKAIYVAIADQDIAAVRQHFNNWHIDLDFQQDGTFFYKVWGWDA